LWQVKPSYNHIARYYDQLSRLVFGNTLVAAQLWLLDAIPPGAHVLVAGGGTGWILEAIAARIPSGLTITYADPAEQMIALSLKRNVGGNKVVFFTGSAADAPADRPCDVLITPFLFDNFTAPGAATLFAALSERLAGGGRWLYCDYRRTTPLWQRLLLKSMYLFFRLVAGVPARGMPDMPTLFKTAGYAAEKERLFFKGFISSVVYVKPPAA
jgi:ubiquinone/menaquinone biosynthesis C-methylase UbiE